jgi:hypothetical protein
MLYLIQEILNYISTTDIVKASLTALNGTFNHKPSLTDIYILKYTEDGLLKSLNSISIKDK